jgi:tetratricopeptide (TPR) repeat protein
MQAFVFTDKRLERYAGQFVWLQVDIDNAKNAAFLSKYPTPGIPTLLVIDPKSEKVAMRYMSGATVPQLIKLLDDAKRTVRTDQPISADALLLSADSLASAGKNDEALKMYEQALAKAPKKWSRLGRASESYITALAMAHGEGERCASEALKRYAQLRGTMSAANVAATGLSCASDIEEKSAKRDELIAALEKATREALADDGIPMSGDDKSMIYQTLIAARQTMKDDAGAKALTQEWSSFLDGEAAKAESPEERTVYDPHRLGAYIDLGTPEKAIPMLEQSEKDFPSDYNPPSRLAAAYKAMKKYDEALAASERALKNVYGPRKVTMLRNRADIYLAKGDKDAARKTLQQAIDYADSLPKGQRNESTVAGLKKKLEGI